MRYSVIDVLLTLRCNCKCLNCIKLCNMEDLTGLDYSVADLSMQQVEKFISDIEKLGPKPVVDIVFLTGGEPTLHKDLLEITKLVQKRLVDTKLVLKLAINTNSIKPLPEELQPYGITFSSPINKPLIHQPVFLHPDNMRWYRPTQNTCDHYRKNTVVYSYKGYNRCCAADGYIRLFGADSLYVDTLPERLEDFPNLDPVCKHCHFGTGIIVQEKDVGRPISKIYIEQMDKNKAAMLSRH